MTDFSQSNRKVGAAAQKTIENLQEAVGQHSSPGTYNNDLPKAFQRFGYQATAEFKPEKLRQVLTTVGTPVIAHALITHRGKQYHHFVTVIRRQGTKNTTYLEVLDPESAEDEGGHTIDNQHVTSDNKGVFPTVTMANGKTLQFTGHITHSIRKGK